MSFSVNFNRHQNVKINQNYANQLLNNDKDTKVVLGRLDKIFDRIRPLFHMEKKADVLNELYNVIHGGAEGDSLGSVSAFNRLKALADPVHRDQFHYTFDDKAYPDSGTTSKHINFMIGNEKIHSAPLRDVLYNINLGNYTNVLTSRDALGNMTRDYCLQHIEDFSAMFRDGEGKAISLELNDDRQLDSLAPPSLEMTHACLKYWAVNNPKAEEFMKFLVEIGFNDTSDSGGIANELSLEVGNVVNVSHQEIKYVEDLAETYNELRLATDYFEQEQPYTKTWNMMKKVFPPEVRLEKYQGFKNPELHEDIFTEALIAQSKGIHY